MTFTFRIHPSSLTFRILPSSRGCKIYFLGVESPPSTTSAADAHGPHLLHGCREAAAAAAMVSSDVRQYRRTALELSVLSHGGTVVDCLREDVTHIVFMAPRNGKDSLPGASAVAAEDVCMEPYLQRGGRSVVRAASVVSALYEACASAAAEAMAGAATGVAAAGGPGEPGSGGGQRRPGDRRLERLLRSVRQRLVAASVWLGGVEAGEGSRFSHQPIHLVDPRCGQIGGVDRSQGHASVDALLHGMKV